MFIYPFINLFLISLFTSTFMAISSAHWLIIWISLEINIISFIPLISSFSWNQETEGALKYLLFQALGSTFILAGNLRPSFIYLPLIGLFIKLGVAPLHYWFPSVIKRLSWFSAALLMTWQKIAPMFIIISIYSDYKMLLSFIGVVRALVGGFGGVGQNHLRSLLAYSSIGHIGWILASSSFAPAISVFYLLCYIFISLALIRGAILTNISSLFQSSKPNFAILCFLVIPCTLSLSGLPPFIGFFPKIFAILSFPGLIVPLFLLLGSILNLSYYLNFFFILFLSSPKRTFLTSQLYTPKSPALLAFIASSPVPLVFSYVFFI